MPLVLYTLFGLALLPYALAMTGAYYRVRQFGRFDNHYPRLQQAELRGAGARVQAAQGNAWEALLVYAVSVFIAFAAGVDLRTLDTAALVFAAARVAHAACYLLDLASLRSMVFGVGMACCVYIFVRAVMHIA
jgi:uncharacterized MAPEG superfamily protein